MHGGSGLCREKLHEARVLAETSVRDGCGADPGVREEQYLSQLIRDVEAGALSAEDAERALYAFRDSVIPREIRNIPVAERGRPLGGLALGEPEF